MIYHQEIEDRCYGKNVKIKKGVRIMKPSHCILGLAINKIYQIKAYIEKGVLGYHIWQYFKVHKQSLNLKSLRTFWPWFTNNSLYFPDRVWDILVLCSHRPPRYGKYDS